MQEHDKATHPRGESLRHAVWRSLRRDWQEFQRDVRDGGAGGQAKPNATPQREQDMSRQRRDESEELGRLATEKLRDLLTDDPLEKRQRWLERERLRDERRRVSRANGVVRLIGIGVGLVVGGLASISLPTTAAVGLGIVSAGLIFYAFRLLHNHPMGRAPAAAAARIEAPKFNAQGMADSRAETTRAVLDRAAEALRETQAKAKGIADPEVRASIERLGASGQRILTAVAERPDLLGRAQRVLTYHTERAVFLVGSLAATAKDAQGDAQRYGAIKHVLARMENLFERTALDLVAGDGKEMDLELRLISQALDEDLRP